MSDSPIKPASLALKDLVSISISVLALSISALSFYVSNIRVQESAYARVLGTEEPELQFPLSTDFEASLALINSGNRPVIVTEASYFIDTRPKGSPSSIDRKVIPQRVEFPIILAPHDVHVLRIDIFAQDIIDALGAGNSELTQLWGASDQAREFYLGFAISTVGSNGSFHRVFATNQIAIQVDPKSGFLAHAPLKSRESKLPPLIDLLQ